MADIIGPSNKLPGQTIGFVPDGRSCDYCNKPAIHAVVGETDSFGSEIHHVCNEDYIEIQKSIQEEREKPKHCEICHSSHTDCQPFRDPSEGSCGPVYDACPDCRKRIIDYFIGDDENPEVDFDEVETIPNYDYDED